MRWQDLSPRGRERANAEIKETREHEAREKEKSIKRDEGSHDKGIVRKEGRGNREVGARKEQGDGDEFKDGRKLGRSEKGAEGGVSRRKSSRLSATSKTSRFLR